MGLFRRRFRRICHLFLKRTIRKYKLSTSSQRSTHVYQPLHPFFGLFPHLRPPRNKIFIDRWGDWTSMKPGFGRSGVLLPNQWAPNQKYGECLMQLRNCLGFHTYIRPVFQMLNVFKIYILVMQHLITYPLRSLFVVANRIYIHVIIGIILAHLALNTCP